MTNFDPEVWGPHYWFVIFTMALTYPENVTKVTKKKYYDFIQNLPLFIPCDECGKHFAKLLDKYPVSPYLDSKDSFIRWVHFIHNRLNEELDPPKPIINLKQALERYYKHYEGKKEKYIANEIAPYISYIYYVVFLIVIMLIIWYLYSLKE